jgi:hypothetical protein
MAVEVPLSKGQISLIDDEDAERVMQWKWCACWNPTTRSYVGMRNLGNRKMAYLHRFIMEATPEQEVDHKDHDTLNNQKYNLRCCLPYQNKANGRLPRSNTSGYKGIVLLESGRWSARVKYRGKTHYAGTYVTKEEAARAYNEKAKELLGEFAYLNDV